MDLLPVLIFSYTWKKKKKLDCVLQEVTWKNREGHRFFQVSSLQNDFPVAGRAGHVCSHRSLLEKPVVQPCCLLHLLMTVIPVSILGLETASFPGHQSLLEFMAVTFWIEISLVKRETANGCVRLCWAELPCVVRKLLWFGPGKLMSTLTL